MAIGTADYVQKAYNHDRLKEHSVELSSSAVYSVLRLQFLFYFTVFSLAENTANSQQ